MYLKVIYAKFRNNTHKRNVKELLVAKLAK